MKKIKKFSEFNKNDELNESLSSNIVKGYNTLSSIVKNFKKLFNSSDRNDLINGLKLTNKIIDFIFFINENESLFDGSLEDKDIKILSKIYKIDDESLNIIDIVEIKYEKEFKRKLKNDLKDFEKFFNLEKNIKDINEKGDIKMIRMYKELKTSIEYFTNLIYKNKITK